MLTMKMQELKRTVFELTETQDTKQLRQQRPDLTKGRDLRYKAQWQLVLGNLKALREEGLDFSLADLARSEGMLKDSLVKVGRIAGLQERQIESDWQRIKLEAQFADIRIEDL
jgi:hypothetical protein